MENSIESGISISKLKLVLILVGLFVGVPVGISTTIFIYEEGFTYFSGKPTACISCHVMQPNFDAWKASSHREVATCNDCHTSGSAIRKFSQKALNGVLHTWAYTTGNYHEPIQIKPFNRKLALESCLNCHSNVIETTHVGRVGFEKNQCLNCHKGVGHRKWSF